MTTIKYEAVKLLNNCGIKGSLKGYDFLVTAIELYYSDKVNYYYITKALYPEIAKRHNTTPSRVERAIRHSLKKLPDRPTNGEFISNACRTIEMSKDGRKEVAEMERFNIHEEMVRKINERFPEATKIGKPFWYKGCCEIQFYPNSQAVEPYAAVYRNGWFEILTEF